MPLENNKNIDSISQKLEPIQIAVKKFKEIGFRDYDILNLNIEEAKQLALIF